MGHEDLCRFFLGIRRCGETTCRVRAAARSALRNLARYLSILGIAGTSFSQSVLGPGSSSISPKPIRIHGFLPDKTLQPNFAIQFTTIKTPGVTDTLMKIKNRQNPTGTHFIVSLKPS